MGICSVSSLRGFAKAEASVRSTDPHLQIQKNAIDCHDLQVSLAMTKNKGLKNE